MADLVRAADRPDMQATFDHNDHCATEGWATWAAFCRGKGMRDWWHRIHGDAVGDELEAPAYAQSVLPAEIAAQREKGWPDFHPETFCHRCGRRNINWWTTAEAWEAATANLPRKELEILCPQCFADLWEQETGERSAWQVRRGSYLSRGGRARPNEHTSPPRRPTVADDDLDLIEAIPASRGPGVDDRYVALTVAERDALVAEVRRLRAEVAQLDAICWALNERTPTTVDAESGFRVGGRACEHPSLTGGRCDACGWTEAWQADRAANDVRYAANMTDALVAEVRHLRDLLTRAIPHIDPNDSDAAHQLLRDCEEATRG